MNKDVFSYLYADSSNEKPNICSTKKALADARNVSSRYSSTRELKICWGMLDTTLEEAREGNLEK